MNHGINITSRALHDTGLAVWFGGTLANAVALNAAAGHTHSATDAGEVTSAGWDRWTPVNAAAIGAHLLGSIGQLADNADRVRGQQGVATMAIVKTALTAAALGITAYSRALGRTVSSHGTVPVSDGTTPHALTPPAVAEAQKKLKALQWGVPALTGALVVVSAFAGEQQRPKRVLHGVAAHLAGNG